MADDTISPDSVIIYGLFDPETDELCYIGKTSRTLHLRLRQHIVRSREGLRSHVGAWIRNLLACELEPEIFLIERVAKDAWADAEKHWVAFYRGWGIELLNMTIGGGSTEGHRHTPETIAKIKAIVAKQWADPKNREVQRQKAKEAWARDDVRAKCTEARRLTSANPEWRAKQSETRKRLWAEDPEFRAKMAAGQERVDRTAIAKDFWKRPEYQERHAAARARRKARGWRTPASEAKDG